MSDHELEPTERPKRFVSIDALRGFDMFWIIGAGAIVEALPRPGETGEISESSASRLINVLATQLEHVEWEGFHFYDLIFPLFVFLVGTSTVFSLDRIVKEHGKLAAYWRVVRRSVLLYLLGVFFYGALTRDGSPEMFRYVGVLQRIAICYLCGGILYINLKFRGLLVATGVILVGYWGWLTFVPVPGGVAGDYSEGANWTNYIDQEYLSGYKWDGPWDPEGLLSNVPAVASGILGMFAGILLRRDDLPAGRRILYLLLAGIGCLALGWLWGLQFPIIKKLWTSSYVLFAGGWSFLLVAVFHTVIDVGKFGIWARPFVWIGMNPITIYLLVELVDFNAIVRRVIHQPLIDEMDPWGPLVVAVIGLAIPIAFCQVLYRHRIFLRL